MEPRFKLSVVMPVFNGSDTIEKALTSICLQKGAELGRDYEVIVVNDGSTDMTEALVSQFPVKLINLPSNRGRIVARETGALAAGADVLLFIDARVIVSANLLERYFAIQGRYPNVYAGELGESMASKESKVDLFFFRMRERYYAPYYPQKEPFVQLTPDNFGRVPKGTTCLFISKDIFLKSIPRHKDNSVNDDTRLFHHIVFDQQQPLYRSTEVEVTYLQRRELSSLRSWLMGRGVLFSDFHLQRQPIYKILYGVTLLLIAMLLWMVFTGSIWILGILGFLAIIYFSGVAYLSRSINEAIAFSYLLGPTLLFFWCGIGKGLILRLMRRYLST